MNKLLLDLLKFESTADNNPELHKIVDYVERLFNETKVHTRRYVKNDKPSIVVTTNLTKRPKIMLSGHLDVVPADPKDFIPYEKDGKIFARGASDMKGVVSAMIEVFQELANSDQNYDIGLMLTTDEEQGGFDGAGYLTSEHGYGADIVFLPDGYEGNWGICTDEKGIWWIEVSAEGKSAHGSRPWMGENAIEKLMDCIQEMKTEVESKWGIPTLEDDWKPSFNIGNISGGEATNSVPAKAVAKIDIRFPDSVDQKELSQILKSVVDKHACKFKKLISAESTHIEPDNKYLKLWKEISKEEFGEYPKTYKTHGASDGRFFASAGAEILSVKPVCSPPHVDDEWIDLESLAVFKNMILKWVHESSTI